MMPELVVATVHVPQWRKLETILLVEDEAFVRKAAAEVLESAGYRLMIAESPAEALELSRQYSGTFDLLLADIVMPGMSGHELAAKFEKLCPRPRVLLMSGYAESAYAERSARHGRSLYSSGYLAKPFSTETLLQKVRELLDANLFDLELQPN
jgi:two-component system, cell cycle sensor histidine kinase and response regulator CckA